MDSRCSDRLIPFPLLAAMLLYYSTAGAVIHHVPDEYETLQEGISAAASGDTVLVAAGEYTGAGNRHLDFGGIDLVLLSESGPELTILDAEGSQSDPHRCIYLQSKETNAAVIDGFTIRNGWAAYYGGGGIYCDQSSPTIRNCVITTCVVPYLDGRGGGILLRSSTARIEDCVITSNWATYGAGIACRGESSPTIIGCVMSGNEAGYGGGIDTGGTSNVLILDCVISGNDATNGFEDPGSGGGAILGGTSVMENCNITGNTSGYGAGIACWDGTPHVSGCTIAGNDAREWNGGGIVSTYSSATIERTALWGNCASIGPEFIADYEGSITFSDCVMDTDGIEQNGGQVIYGTGILVEDPLFCGAEPCVNAPTVEGDYTVSRSSSCVPDNNETGEWIGAEGVGCPAAAVPEDQAGSLIHLGFPHPNPTTGRIDCTIDLRQAGHAQVSILDVTGRRIASPVDRYLPAGIHPVVWMPDQTHKLASGVYIVRLEAPGVIESRAFVLAR